MAVIELQEISKLYGFGDATTLALNEVTLTVEAGEFVAIMGPSGSGKTTLMNVIGLLDKPTHGNYMMDGKHVDRLRANQQARLRRDKIGFVFQSFNLISSINVLDNVALPLAYKGMTLVRRQKRASDMIERIGLRDREYYFPRHLSGGQMQRAAIARALINTPSIIIADEPTGNLDTNDSRVVMELLSEINRQGNTVLMVTHNPELTRYATRVLYMRDGSIVKDEQTEIGEVASGAKKAYFEKPKFNDEDIAEGVSALMKDVPDAELKTNTRKKAKAKPIKRTKKVTRQGRKK